MMSPLIGIFIVLGLAIGIVVLVVWKTLKGPVAPPKQPEPPELRDDSQASPLFDTSTSNELGATRLDGAPPETVRADSHTAQEEPPKPSLEVTPKMVGTAAAFVSSPALTVAYLSARAVMNSTNPQKMTGGDECLGYNRKSLQRKERAIPILNVEVSASGKVTADGREVSVPELEAQLADLKAQGGQVHYHSEAADPQPPQAEWALGVIFGAGLPVVFVGKTE
jgi:hypothetical protein